MTLPQPVLVCANCGASLAGEYCATCGQRHEPHVHTLAHFASEAFESITHADSRLWRTLGYLLTRPGLLTREFFAGRRMRYLPPFRLYLVISVVFFLVGMPAKVSVKQQGVSDANAAMLLKQAEQFESDEMPLPEAMRKQTAQYMRQAAAKAAADPQGSEQGGVNISFGALDLFCRPRAQGAAAESAFRQALRQRCERLASGDGRSLGEGVVHNVPRAMFLFLPLLALVMKALYWRQHRYYVEHLLFLIHNHAFVFLAATLLILVSRVPYTGAVMGWLWTACGGYVVWYIYRAMRQVYGQARGVTLVKYFTLGATYFCTSVIMLMLTVIYSALTL